MLNKYHKRLYIYDKDNKLLVHVGENYDSIFLE